METYFCKDCCCEITEENSQKQLAKKSGISCRCRDCYKVFRDKNNAYVRAHYAKNKVRLLKQKQDKYTNDPEYHERVNARHRTYLEQNKIRAMNRHEKTKLNAIAYKGGVCVRCKQVYNHVSFDFHHLDPSTKEGGVNILLKSKGDAGIRELDKCVLLCSNCHRLVHYEIKRGTFDTNSFI